MVRREAGRMTTLSGKVALVAGGTRGASRAIAVELGRAGAFVYVTGRTTRAGRSEVDRPETIEETACSRPRSRRWPGGSARSTSWSTDSGAATSTSAGANRSGSTTWRRACG
jgi:NAD(P)-dependent dehydrogenase (short-subunit alcohol dehydrogenase family)